MSQSATNNNNSFNTTNSFNNVWNNCTVADDRSQLLTWLSPLEPRLRHRDVRERRVNGVGEWVMETAEFGRWRDASGEVEADNAVLFCNGDPGVGKTFINSLVVDKLCDQAGGQNTAVACFYFDFAARKEQSATNMLGSMLKQMVSGMGRVPEDISRPFQEQQKVIGGRDPGLPDIVKMLQTITSSRRTYMCIDAMDECAAVHRVKVLNSLNQILDKSPGTRIFVTGRPHIRAEMEKRLVGRVRRVSIGPSKGDITTYLRVRLEEDETPEAMDESLEGDILRRIPENISEVFLLVSLNIEAILQESTIGRRRERLNKMVDGLGLGDAYGATIERIKAQGGDKSRLGMAALMWISHAERPLRADELCHALAVELGCVEFKASNIPSISTLVSCCQGLIAVDKEGSAVRLIHFTLQEYLSTHPNLFNGPHSTIAEICLTYLNSQPVKALVADPPQITRDTPFLEYFSIYWGVHAKREPSDCVRSRSLELLKEDYGQISTIFLLSQVKRPPYWRADTWSPISGLHCASFFGIAEVVVALIDMGRGDTNGEDLFGYTPLAWAAHNGHEEVVRILLGREEVNADKPDDEGRTPLSFAAGNGHKGVVKILLGRVEVDPNRPNTLGTTPLSFAAQNGHEGVVEILLGQVEVDLEKPNIIGSTPLSFAASNGHEGVVKILLGRVEVDPNKRGAYGETPLWFAASKGHEGVVKILLERVEVDTNKSGDHHQTPLSAAVSWGHEGVVKMLLGRAEVDPDKPGASGQPPLSEAAAHGHEGVVKILLGRVEVDPNKPGAYHKRPLSWAASNGHEGVVKILLGRVEVDPDKQDANGQTPLSLAAENGHDEVVGILLGLEGVNPDKPDNQGRSPLTLATTRGRKRIVALLQSRKA